MNLNNIGSTVGAVEGIANSIAGLFSGGSELWKEALQQASFRGVPFGVLQTDIQFGRRNAIHEYPYKETVWVEDMGKATRRITFSAFLLENDLAYKGGSVIGQLEKLIAAGEAKEEGELIHPLLGAMDVKLVEASAVAKAESGRMIEVFFAFVESGKRKFPGSSINAAEKLGGLLKDALGEVLGAYDKSVFESLKSGIEAVQAVAKEAAAWANLAQNVINNASRIYNTLRGLPDIYRRYGLVGVSRGIQSITYSTKNLLASRVNAMAQFDKTKKQLMQRANSVSQG